MAIRYVHSTAGDDVTGTGTAGNPWATFSYAHTQAIAGDSIQALDAGPFADGNVGNDTKLIHYLGVGGGVRTVVDASGHIDGFIGYTGRSYTDLEVIDAPSWGWRALSAGRPLGTITRCRALRCNRGFQAANGVTNLDVVSALDCTDYGIDISTTSVCTFRSVEIARCGNRNRLRCGVGSVLHNAVCVNNGGTPGVGYGLDSSGAAGVNVVVDGCACSFGFVAASYRNCMVHASGATPYGAGTDLGGNLSGVDPLWFDEPGGIYRPVGPSSPAWLSGHTSTTATMGVDGYAYTSPPHRGAYALADATPPVVAITSPAHTAAPSYTLAGTATDASGITLLQYRVDGGAWVPLPAAATFSVGITLSQGPNTIEVLAEDPYGNQGTDTLVVVYEPPPVVTITSPAGMAVPSYTLTGTATNAIGIALLQYRVDGGAWVPLPPASSFSVELTLQQGLNAIEVLAEDSYGTQGTDSLDVGYQPPLTRPRQYRLATSAEWYKRLTAAVRGNR